VIFTSIKGLLENRLVIAADSAPEPFISWLTDSGAKIIRYTSLPGLINIADHPDLGITYIPCFKDYPIRRTFIITKAKSFLKEKIEKKGCRVLISEKTPESPYPGDTLFNCLTVFDHQNRPFLIVGSKSCIPDETISLCREKKITILRVNQGYARCTCLAVYKTDSKGLPECCLITDDPSIIKTTGSLNIFCIKCPEIKVSLSNFDCGFFPGACGVFEKGIIICGSLSNLTSKEIASLSDTGLKAGVDLFMPEYSGPEKIRDLGSIFII
jgi:hypothetical protein